MKIIEDARRLAMKTGNFIGQKAKLVGDWCIQHPGEASMIACGVLGFAGKMISNRMSITNADRKILSEARANVDDIYETLRSRGLIR